MIVPVILCGGSGTRLWPLSRENHPKQFLSLTDKKTLLQQTVNRLKGVEDLASPIVLCNEKHRFIVAQQLSHIELPPDEIVLEPVGRNTAPAVAVAAMLARRRWHNPTLLVLPSDHLIENITAFHTALKDGAALASSDYLVTFGIVPSSPETGYGYIRQGARLSAAMRNTTPNGYTIAGFVEKPDLYTAQKYVDSGDYCWNSGMFMFSADLILAELDIYSPEITNACRPAVEKGRQDLDFFRLDPESFKACPENSIDYAVMERTTRGAMVPLDAGWNDLGSWQALWQDAQKDNQGNFISGDVMAHEVTNSYLVASHRLLAAVGLSNHVMVETPDAVFVAPRARVQEVKNIVKQLKSADRQEIRSHNQTYHLWGTARVIVEDDCFQVRHLTIQPGACISKQKHRHRAEHWVVVNGYATVEKGDKTITLDENQSVFIPPGVFHRLENRDRNPLEVIEIQTGSYLNKDDISRS